MKLARSCIFAFNSNIDLVAHAGLGEAESLFGMRIFTGGEAKISAETAQRVSSSFKWKEARIGGQAGNMANAAAALGVKCLAHAYNLSPRQRKLFAKGVEPVGERTGNESVHYVLELKLRNGRRDRLILTHDPANSSLLISPKFASRSLEFVSNGCDRAVVSGFHLLDAKNAEARLSAASQLIRRWRKANPSLRVHFEAGEFSDANVAGLVAKSILPLVDSIGMNERELFAFAPRISALPNISEIMVHTAGYASAASRIRGRDALARALSFGHALAAHRAGTGKFAGLASALRLMKKVRGAKSDENGVSVPSIKITPKFTLGLGDSFSAGYFLAE